MTDATKPHADGELSMDEEVELSILGNVKTRRASAASARILFSSSAERRQ
jgi:hypothetical protein